MTRALALLACLACTGCPSGSSGGSSPALPTPASSQALTVAAPLLAVHLTVVTRSDGSGNPLWTPAYAQRVLDAATALTKGAIIFEVASLVPLAEDGTYALNQAPLLALVRPLRRPGVLTVVLSRPDTTDSAGLSTIQRTIEPLIVMRAREDETTDPETVARILLHEVGHQMNLQHVALPSLGVPWDADTWYTVDEGQAFGATWAQEVGANAL